MTKTEAIAFLQASGRFRVTNQRKAVVTVTSFDDGREWDLTTKQLIKWVQSVSAKESEPEPIHEEEPTITETVPILERDTQAIADAIEKACRIVVMVAVACYVAGYTLGVWVHTVNAWLVALHKRTCKERVEIVLGYIVSGLVSTHATIREAWV